MPWENYTISPFTTPREAAVTAVTLLHLNGKRYAPGLRADGPTGVLATALAGAVIALLGYAYSEERLFQRKGFAQECRDS